MHQVLLFSLLSLLFVGCKSDFGFVTMEDINASLARENDEAGGEGTGDGETGDEEEGTTDSSNTGDDGNTGEDDGNGDSSNTDSSSGSASSGGDDTSSTDAGSGDDGSSDGSDGETGSGVDTTDPNQSVQDYLTALYNEGDRTGDNYSVPSGFPTNLPALAGHSTSVVNSNASGVGNCFLSPFNLNPQTGETHRPSKFNARNLMAVSPASNKVGELVLRGSQDFGVYYREWDGSAWGDLILVDRTYFGRNETVQLFYDSYDVAHAFVQRTDFAIRHFVLFQGAFLHIETIQPNVNIAQQEYIPQIVFQIDSNNRFHVVYEHSSGQIMYGKNTSGAWVFSEVDAGYDAFADDHREFVHDDNWARSLDMVLDDQNRAHIIFSGSREYEEVPGGTRINSRLNYARPTASTAWSVQEIPDALESVHGDEGQSASIARAQDGSIGISVFALDRVSTGSTRYGRLKFLEYNASGVYQGMEDLEDDLGFSQNEYVASDGQMGMGAQAQLWYEGNVPFVVFTDHASAHLPSNESFVGNLRMAHKSTGQWQFQKLHDQSDPLVEEIFQPTFRVHNGQCWVNYTLVE